MLVPIFTLNLNHRFLPHRVAVGCYDGKHPCITAATTGDKIVIHNPHTRGSFLGGRISSSAATADVSLLNINQPVSSLVSGCLVPNGQNDVLVVGTQTSVLAYDVLNNADLFYKEMPDGASSLAIGDLGTISTPLAIVGGSCSLQGFDHQGNDVFWTVTGDNVTSLCLSDFTGDGQLELVVGSEDFDIRVFKEDEIIAEMTETEAISALCPMEGSKFGYALVNGTVGVYDRLARYWRIKSKNYALSIFSFDLDGDGVSELVTGWSNGKLDARNDRTGEVIFKDNFNHPIAGIVQADYRLDGKTELICCATDGEVRGYLPASGEIYHSLLDPNLEQDTIRELTQKKQNLIMELQNYADNSRISNSLKPNSVMSIDAGKMGMIPADTQLQTAVAINVDTGDKPPHVEIALATTNDTIIRTVVIFAEGIFQGESHVVHPKEAQLSSTVRVAIFPPKDVPVDLHIKAMVGFKGSVQYHVFELTRQLPRFSMYSLCQEREKDPEGFVTFQINDRIQRVLLWINQNFLLVDDLELKDSGVLEVTFLSLRSSQILVIHMEQNGQTTVRTDDMELAGNIIQALAGFLNLEDLQSVCEFPSEMEKLNTTLQKVSDFNSTRQTMMADMADHSGIVRSLIVRGEDSRLIGDYKSMKRWYMELHEINKDLVSNYKIRSNNHQELLNCLKIVNQTIQKAGQLRVGKSKTQLITACRAAIQGNNVTTLFKIIKTGVA